MAGRRIVSRYRASSKHDKTRILDEFVAVTGHHRKHGIRLLRQPDDDAGALRPGRDRRIYDEVVREAVIVEGLEAIGQRLPFPVRGIDSDNNGAFINETLIAYCADCGIECTRSRPYRKNCQAWIQQKNGSVARRFVGHGRYSG